MFTKNKKILRLFCTTMFIGSMMSQSVNAKLSVAPQYIVFEKGTPKVQTVSVINNSDKKKTYNVKLLHYKQINDGSYVQIEEEEKNDKFADSMLFFGPRRFTLESREAQTIKIQRKPKADLEPGEYKSHILFQEAEEEKIATSETNTEAKGLSFTITALYGVSIPVVVRIGDLFAEAKIENVKHVKDKEKDFVNLDIIRDGNKSLRGDIFIKYDGKQIGQLRGINIFLSINSRNVSIPLSLEEFDANELKGKKLNIEYIVDNKVAAASEVIY